MNRNLLALTALLLVSLSISAQTTTNYNLSDYKLPEYRYQALETGIDLSGFSNSNISGDYKVPSRQFNGDVDADYYSYLNSTKIQRSQNMHISLSGISKFKDDSISRLDYSSFYPSFSYSIRNKRYFPNKVFIGTDLSVVYRYAHSLNSSEYKQDTLFQDNENTWNNHLVTVGIPLKIGIGRIEQVQDYQEAIYIYEDLVNSGRAVTGKTDAEVMELATLITRLKEKRFFDSRIKNIQDIEALDSFLIVNNYKTLSDARFYATLVDNWNFVNHFYRRSGTTVSLGVTPGYSYEKDSKRSDFDDFTDKKAIKSYNAYGGFEFEHYKPINLYWQSNTSFNAYARFDERHYFYYDTIEAHDNIRRFRRMDLSFYQSINYYPNTRTQMSAGLQVDYIQHFDEKDRAENIPGSGRKELISSVFLSVDYYVSPKVRFDFSSSLYYRNYDIPDYYNETKTFRANYNLRLSYSIF